ncbi:MAG: xylose isomerase, partial [Gemmatimonadetes bacterium]|nr:xylose isomerase [Gemmatimonadota bacterium]
MILQRREFLRVAAAAGAAGAAAAAGLAPLIAATGPTLARDVTIPGRQAGRRFKLRYAPHFGMFQNHAGEDLIAQLRFMAAEGFTALEDNGMRGRPVEDQRRIAVEMGRLGMKMGVFVAHTIGWNEANLASGDAGKRDQFLAEIRESVEVAKRVKATWMTVVPGHVDPRLEPSYQTA